MKVKIPTLSHKTRQGWGTLWLRVTFIGLLSAAISLPAQQASEPPSKELPPDQTEPTLGTVPAVTPGKLIKSVAPKYPKEERKKHIEGQVILKGTITKTGDVVDLQLVSGQPLLVQAALDAVAKWKYRPYLKDGQAVDVETQITVNFSLSH
jgi:protein TonB